MPKEKCLLMNSNMTSKLWLFEPFVICIKLKMYNYSGYGLYVLTGLVSGFKCIGGVFLLVGVVVVIGRCWVL